MILVTPNIRYIAGDLPVAIFRQLQKQIADGMWRMQKPIVTHHTAAWSVISTSMIE